VHPINCEINEITNEINIQTEKARPKETSPLKFSLAMDRSTIDRYEFRREKDCPPLEIESRKKHNFLERYDDRETAAGPHGIHVRRGGAGVDSINRSARLRGDAALYRTSYF